MQEPHVGFTEVSFGIESLNAREQPSHRRTSVVASEHLEHDGADRITSATIHVT